MALLPNWDAFTIKRPVDDADDEGNPFNGFTTVGTGSGVYGSASAREQEVAGQRGQVLDAFLSTASNDLRIGDVLELRNATWTVVSVKDVRIHNRVGLRMNED